MNFNATLILTLVVSIVFYGVLLSALLKLKKQTQANGASVMLFSLLAMIVSSIALVFLEQEARWFLFLEAVVNSLTLLIFCIGFYRFAKWAIYQESNLNNDIK